MCVQWSCNAPGQITSHMQGKCPRTLHPHHYSHFVEVCCDQGSLGFDEWVNVIEWHDSFVPDDGVTNHL